LTGKLGADMSAVMDVNRPAPAGNDVLNALLALGYSDKEALLAIKQIPAGLSVSEGIRHALRLLSKV
jgi:Holliday junction DNA helicase RuvA